MPFSRAIVAPVALTLVSGLALSACSTNDYVDEQIASVNQRISALESSTQSGLQSANSAASSANAAAQAAASQAQNNSGAIDALNARVDGLEQQMMEERTPRN